MTIVAVDLAAKFSAACVMQPDGSVAEQWDSWNRSERSWVGSLLTPFMYPDAVPDALIVEDLPHRLPHTGTVKAVSRLQGRIYERFDRVDLVAKIVFVAPATWRNTFPLLRKKGLGPSAVISTAKALGYEPPADLWVRAKNNGGKGRADKVASDYCSAFLIGRWALEQQRQAGGFDVPGTSRYGTRQIPRGDTHG